MSDFGEFSEKNEHKEERENRYMIECENLVKIYKMEDIEVIALQGLDLTVEAGELMAIIGNSGSGKSTLLNMIGGLDHPSAGKLYVNGENLLKYTDEQLVMYKRKTVGFVWQNNARNLIPYLTARQNVEMPMFLAGKAKKQKALELLDLVGLSARVNNRLTELSGGEQQRVAIAISLANDPKMILADEPTGSVDTQTAANILDVFRRANQQYGVTVIIVTHDRQLNRLVDRVVAIRDGRTSSEFIRTNAYAEEMKHMTEVHDDLTETVMNHQELIVVDRVGRLQVPRDYLEAIGVDSKSKLKVDLEGDRIILTKPDESKF